MQQPQFNPFGTPRCEKIMYGGVDCPSLDPSVFPLSLIAQLQLYPEQRYLLDH